MSSRPIIDTSKTHLSIFSLSHHIHHLHDHQMITPDEIIRYFKFKLYGDGDVDISDKPLTGSHHTLGKCLTASHLSIFRLSTLRCYVTHIVPALETY